MLVVFNATAEGSLCFSLSKLIERPIVNWDKIIRKDKAVVFHRIKEFNDSGIGIGTKGKEGF